MSAWVTERLPEFVLGTLPIDEMERVELAVAESEALQLEVATLTDALLSVPDTLAPVAPPPGGRARLFEAISGADRFLPFVADLSRYFDLAADKVRELFKLIDVDSAWEDSPFPGIRLIHFDGGPNKFAADTGWVELPVGLEFPWHEHYGVEINYILQGHLRNSIDGRVYGPGEALIHGPEHQHQIWVHGDEKVVLAVIQDGFGFVEKPD